MITLSAQSAEPNGGPRGSVPARVAAATTICISLLAGCAAVKAPAASANPVSPAEASQSCDVAGLARARFTSGRELAGFIATKIKSTSCARVRANRVVRYQDIEYYATVSNATMAHSFTAFAVATRDIRVQPSSSARIAVVSYRPPRLITASERARWVAAGKPPMPSGPVTGQSFSLPAGTFTFSPIGTPMTYSQVTALPASPRGVAAQLMAHDRPHGSGSPQVTGRLMQLGFLLAAAPLSTGARSAAWSVLAQLPGLRLCGRGKDLAGAAGQWICVSTGAEEMKVLVDMTTGSVLAVGRFILTATPWFPGVPRESLVLSDSFTPLS